MDSAVTSTECRTPDGPVKLTVHVRSATARQRITFAFISPSGRRAWTVRLSASQQGCRPFARHFDDRFAAGPHHLAVSENSQPVPCLVDPGAECGRLFPA